MQAVRWRSSMRTLVSCSEIHGLIVISASLHVSMHKSRMIVI